MPKSDRWDDRATMRLVIQLMEWCDAQGKERPKTQRELKFALYGLKPKKTKGRPKKTSPLPSKTSYVCYGLANLFYSRSGHKNWTSAYKKASDQMGTCTPHAIKKNHISMRNFLDKGKKLEGNKPEYWEWFLKEMTDYRDPICDMNN